MQVPLDRYSGELVGGEDAIATTIPLSSNFPMSSDYPNANGIEVRDLAIRCESLHRSGSPWMLGVGVEYTVASFKPLLRLG